MIANIGRDTATGNHPATSPALRKARITATLLVAIAAALIGVLLTESLNGVTAIANIITCLLVVLAFAAIVAAEAISIRLFPEPADLRDFAVRHTLALAALLAGVITCTGLSRQAAGYLREDLRLVAVALAVVIFVWLFYCWRFETDVLLRQNTLRLWREHRLVAILFGAITVLPILAWAIWVQPFNSAEAVLAFALPQLASLAFWTLFVQVLKTWPTSPLRQFSLVVLCMLWLGLAVFDTAVINEYCNTIDCGGWLMRSSQPAPWSEQQQAARAALGPEYVLTNVSAQLVGSQTQHETHIFIAETYSFQRADGAAAFVTIQDTAPIWQRRITLFAPTPATMPATDIAPVLAQTRIGPSDLPNLTVDTALAANATLGMPFDPDMRLLTPDQAKSDLGLSADPPPVWQILYRRDSLKDHKYSLSIWVNGITGEIMKQELE